MKTLIEHYLNLSENFSEADMRVGGGMLCLFI